MSNSIAVLWQNPKVAGEITLKYDGNIQALRTEQGSIQGAAFTLEGCGQARLDITIDGAMTQRGAYATIVNVRTQTNPFSFFLRDVNAQNPIYIPEYGVAVTQSDDQRTYEQIVADIGAQGRQGKVQQFENEPEESFESAAEHTRDLKCWTWLGISRDIRMFEVGFHATGEPREVWDWICPKYHNRAITLPETGDKPIKFDYFAGRGLGCEQQLTRRLEDGVLPVLNTVSIDDGMRYEMKLFATLEKSPLVIENVEGTHYLVADQYSAGIMFTPEQEQKRDALHDGELERDEETVCYLRVKAINTTAAPRYAFMRIPQPNVYVLPDMNKAPSVYEQQSGLGYFTEDRVFMTATLDGQPVPQVENAVLLQPGEVAVFEFKIPHRPISRERALTLAQTDFDQKLDECITFWRNKLDKAADISVPEQRIDEMIRAAILHFDIMAYGNEPDGALAQTIGCYSPIGSESSPMLMFNESIGYLDNARRSIMYFLERQHDSGFIQTFGGYMLETGSVLWNVGEYYRYTRDEAWIRSIRPNIIKACDYLIDWIERNKRDELKDGRGYGMIEGKVADPEDPFHSYMLNGTCYIGLKRSVEVLRAIGAPEADRIARYADEHYANVRQSLDRSFAEAPCVPLSNGHWCPSLAAWTENTGTLCLYADGGQWYTHATVNARDAICGSQYMLIHELVDPNETYGSFIINGSADMFYLRNVAFSQPYYSVHPLANLVRGEVKSFIKEFYTNMSSLADRETYSFWEHYHYASPNKTHEEGWFAMRCRWMLYLQDEDTLTLLPGVPRKWLEQGKRIAVKGMQTYFGPLAFTVESDVSRGSIKVCVELSDTSRLPKSLKVRIPHPAEQKAVAITQGEYCPCCETVTLDQFTGKACFELKY